MGHLVWGNIIWDSGLALSKFFAWREMQRKGWAHSTRVFELGAGTGIVGLTLGKMGATVTMTDNEPEVLELLRQNATANCVTNAKVHELNWSDRQTFLKPSIPFNMIVAADVLYSKKDRWFVPALEAHMALNRSTITYLACPPREDSPLSGFFAA